MPFWIEGWVEISRFTGQEKQEENAWSGAINLSTIIDVSDHVSEQLFGLSKRCVAGEVDIEGIFATRGSPPNPSNEVLAELKVIAKHECQYGPGECGGYTYALWSEVKNIPNLDEMLKDSDWNTVANLVLQLEKDHRFSDDQIRLVVWFNW